MPARCCGMNDRVATKVFGLSLSSLLMIMLVLNAFTK